MSTQLLVGGCPQGVASSKKSPGLCLAWVLEHSGTPGMAAGQQLGLARTVPRMGDWGQQ